MSLHFHNKRHRTRPRPSPIRAATGLAISFGLAYGAYRLGSWAWNSYFMNCEKHSYDQSLMKDSDSDLLDEQQDDEDQDGDASYEWCDNSRINYNSDESLQHSTNQTHNQSRDFSSAASRSRRSRLDWGSTNQRHRSRRPSPKKELALSHDSTVSHINQNLKGDTTISTSKCENYNNISRHSPTQSSSFSYSSHLHLSRAARMAKCRVETCHAFKDILPALKKAVAKATDTTQETKELKRLRLQRKEMTQHGIENENEKKEIRQKERDLWNIIKNQSVTRLLTTIYVHNIAFLVLTVQVYLLGGRLLRQEKEEDVVRDARTGLSNQAPSSTDDQITNEKSPEMDQDFTSSIVDRYRSTHQKVLEQTYQYLFEQGIPLLAKDVLMAVQNILQDWDVLGSMEDDESNLYKGYVSLEDITSWFEFVRDKIELRGVKSVSSTSALVQYVIRDESQIVCTKDGNANGAIDEELAKYIIDETYDLLESPLFAMAENSCLDTTFAQLHNDGYANLFLHSNDNVIDENTVVTQPLASVVSHLQKVAVSTFYKSSLMKNEGERLGILCAPEQLLPTYASIYIARMDELSDVLELGNACFA